MLFFEEMEASLRENSPVHDGSSHGRRAGIVP